MSRSSLKNICRLIDAAKVKQPVEESFLADLKRSMELTEAKNQRKPSQSYKPSSMNCIRNMFYQVTGADPDPSHRGACLINICHSGSDIHERIQEAVSRMKENGIDCEYIDVAEYVKSRNLDYLEIVSKNGWESKLFHKELNISFLCDGVIRYMGRYYILEIKTETVYKWISRDGVNPDHYNQGTSYSMALGIDDVLFVYINRDNLDMKAYMFHVTDNMKQTIVSRIEECDSYVKKLVCPPKPVGLSKKACEYCPYRRRCKSDA